MGGLMLYTNAPTDWFQVAELL